MTDRIPKDIVAAAMRALMVDESDMVDSVARALWAERKRCAEIARKMGRHLRRGEDGVAEYVDGNEVVATAILGGQNAE